MQDEHQFKLKILKIIYYTMQNILFLESEGRVAVFAACASKCNWADSPRPSLLGQINKRMFYWLYALASCTVLFLHFAHLIYLFGIITAEWEFSFYGRIFIMLV